MSGEVIQGDCLEVMSFIPDKSIDVVITSPPYDDLRSYNGSLDWGPHIWQPVIKDLYRLLKDGGVVVWIVGDAVIKKSESGTSFKQALYFKDTGFNIHDTMIYEKCNFANPSSTRYHQIFEYMFIFSKGSPKTFNPIKDKKNAYAGHSNWAKENKNRQKDGTLKERKKKVFNEYGMRLNIWRYNTGCGFAGDKIMYKHPAPFPEQLANDHIISWSNEGDTILDPFAGSGTVGKMAIKLNRKYILIEKEPIYVDIINDRLNLINGLTISK